MKEHTLKISGMSCDHCVRTVHSALNTLPNVTIQEVVVGRARIKCPSEQLTEATRVLKEEGFEVVLPSA